MNVDKQSELLIRSVLHDMANLLAGVQGILDMADPGRPLSQRDRDRLGAVLDEGRTTLSRTRHLARATLPDPLLQEGVDWRAELLDELRPLGILFRCQFEIVHGGGTGPDLWPTLLRSYVRAAVRHALPYAQGHRLELLCATGPGAWTLRLRPVSILPEGLLALPRDTPGDICTRWAHTLGTHLGIALSCDDDALTLRMPRT